MDSSFLVAGVITLILLLASLGFLLKPSGSTTAPPKKTSGSKPTSSGPAAPPKPIGSSYTAEEVKKHDKEDDLWLIIDGKVYDFTEYFIQHPGADAILNNAGADSTVGFHGPQHGDNVKRMISDYYIGELAKN